MLVANVLEEGFSESTAFHECSSSHSGSPQSCLLPVSVVWTSCKSKRDLLTQKFGLDVEVDDCLL